MNDTNASASARSASGTWIPLLVLLSLPGVGCGDDKDTSAPTRVQLTGGVSAGETVTGRRTLTATAEDDSGKVAKVEFYLSTTRICTDGVEKNSGETFSCEWDSSNAAQGAQEITAKASDAAGNSASSAPIAITIPPPNREPSITQVTASPAGVNEGSNTTLSVSANDPDGDALTYSWTQLPVVPAGAFGSESGASRTWTAPIVSRNTTFTLKVTVSDGRGGTAESTVAIAVTNVAALNRAPNVGDITPDPATSVVAGQTLTLFVPANDLDGDPLTYTWTTTPAGQGTFTTPNESVARWHSPEIAATKSFTLQVTVSDGTDSVTRTLPMDVRVPSYAQNVEPIWSPTCTTCHSDNTSSGSLNLQAGSSYASLVNKNGIGECNSLKRVLPGQPEESLLVQKISGTACGGRMPQNDPEYFDTNTGELIMIRSWILAGAPNN
ncbi:Ig-like domain-containing protein [Hyalangium versicolor]|uniref:Ig-like domain-containing protein n=1 Tax=Hyalangium versicolor TaxID=2861190 RepID=UPI001CCE0B77|nr:Ig-like domain-containing protein [Hyalangium versicolor]